MPADVFWHRPRSGVDGDSYDGSRPLDVLDEAVVSGGSASAHDGLARIGVFRARQSDERG